MSQNNETNFIREQEKNPIFMIKTIKHTHFNSTYTDIGMIERRLAWFLCKNDT